MKFILDFIVETIRSESLDVAYLMLIELDLIPVFSDSGICIRLTFSSLF